MSNACPQNVIPLPSVQDQLDTLGKVCWEKEALLSIEYMHNNLLATLYPTLDGAATFPDCTPLYLDGLKNLTAQETDFFIGSHIGNGQVSLASPAMCILMKNDVSAYCFINFNHSEVMANSGDAQYLTLCDGVAGECIPVISVNIANQEPTGECFEFTFLDPFEPKFENYFGPGNYTLSGGEAAIFTVGDTVTFPPNSANSTASAGQLLCASTDIVTNINVSAPTINQNVNGACDLTVQLFKVTNYVDSTNYTTTLLATSTLSSTSTGETVTPTFSVPSVFLQSGECLLLMGTSSCYSCNETDCTDNTSSWQSIEGWEVDFTCP